MRSTTVTSVLVALSLALTISSHTAANSSDAEKAEKRGISKRLDALRKKLASQSPKQKPDAYESQGGLTIFGIKFHQAPATQEEIDAANEDDGD